MSEGNTGDSGGREFKRVAGELRMRMANGEYPMNAFLPAQRDLAKEFGVSRDTVQRVLKELQSEGWIDTRQGSGSRVIRSPTSSTLRMATLGQFIDQAFKRSEVRLDVSALTSESLYAHIRLHVERIIEGRQDPPQRITLRMLLPGEKVDMPYWRTGDKDLDELLKARYLDITHQHTALLRRTLNELKSSKRVPSVEFELRRTSRLAPAFKAYLVNGEEVLQGFYEVYERGIPLDDGREIEAVDVVGLGARLTHFVRDQNPSSPGTMFVETIQAWFDSTWEFLTE